MEVTKTLKPGEPGTARLLRRFGDRLICVRYRHDPESNKHITTVELIVDEREATGGYHPIYPTRRAPKQQVLVRIGFEETDLRARVKQADRRWDPDRRGWILPYATVQALGLEGRIMEEEVPISGQVPEGHG